jgi:hypothetical protein
MTPKNNATDTAAKGGFAPPYVSFKTMQNLIERMAAEGGVPSRIDRSYLSNLPGSTQTQVIAGLKSLGLIDQQLRPSQLLITMVENPDIRPEAIGGAITEHYGAALALSKNATQQQLEEVFRDYGVTGSTMRKAIAFFLAAVKFAGIELSPHFRTPRVQTANGRRRPAKRKTPKPEDDHTPEPEAPMDDLKQQYVASLVKKVGEGDADPDLLSRVEWLLGFREEPPEAGTKPAPKQRTEGGDGP